MNEDQVYKPLVEVEKCPSNLEKLKVAITTLASLVVAMLVGWLFGRFLNSKIPRRAKEIYQSETSPQ